MRAACAQIALMRTLQHRYVVECIGYGSADPAGPSTSGRGMFLVSELMEGGTLKKVWTVWGGSCSKRWQVGNWVRARKDVQAWRVLVVAWVAGCF